MNEIPQWVRKTLANEQWALQNWKAVLQLFPEAPQENTQRLLLQIGFRAKLIGLEWGVGDVDPVKSLSNFMTILCQLGFAKIWVADGCNWIQRNPDYVFLPSNKTAAPTAAPAAAPPVRSPATSDFLKRLEQHKLKTIH